MHHKYRCTGPRDFTPTGEQKDMMHWEPGDIVDSKDVPGWVIDGWRSGGFIMPIPFEEGEELTVNPPEEIVKAPSEDERV